MDDVYLIEIRLGRTKWRIKQTIVTIARTFGIEPYMERHPHVTLYGPMELKEGISQQQIFDTIAAIAVRYDPVPFTLDQFERREGMHGGVIAFSIRPSGSLKKLAAEVTEALLPITRSYNAWDARPEQKWFHVTVANRLDLTKASAVFSALPAPDSGDNPPVQPCGVLARILYHLRTFLFSGKDHLIRPILLDEDGLRITVMHGEQILAEYDLLEKHWVYEDHRHDGRSWQETLTRFRKHAGFERTGPCPRGAGDILLIADLHLGHANIIRYGSRPFTVFDPGEMDRVLIANWNAVTTPKTRVYHLGDLRYGRTTPPAGEYRKQLKGDITFIAGNHDAPEPAILSSAIIEYKGTRFLLIHDPAMAPATFDGWVVHGHHHNNDLRHYPFIDFDHRRINVSTEVAGYVPVSLVDTWSLVQYRMSTGNTQPILLNYPYTE
jgi:calcineurin-like phosphoesterase family protein/2'-5' RNA ligase